MKIRMPFIILASCLLFASYGCGGDEEFYVHQSGGDPEPTPTTVGMRDVSFLGDNVRISAWPTDLTPTAEIFEEKATKPTISIFDAAASGDVETVKRHMSVGTPLDQFIPGGAPYAGASPLHTAVLIDGNSEILQVLLNNGADIEIKATDQPGGTPLQWAAFWGTKDNVEFLVSAGADINAIDNNKCSILCATTIPNSFVKDTDDFQKNRIAISEFLTGKGAK